MNKKGFVLMETIVVILIVSVALLTLFSSFNKILTKMKTQNRYDTPEYIYMVNYIKDRMHKDLKPKDPDDEIFDFVTASSSSDTPHDFMSDTYYTYPSYSYYYFTSNERKMLKEIFNVKYIYLVKGISSEYTTSNLYKFPPSVAEYVKKLDVSATDEIIIVVFERPALDENGNIKKMYYKDSSGNIVEKNLTHTYIASLKW